MRESIGGAWLFGIVITFIFLFAGFLTYSISYTKAFNTKNEIINYIEHGEGYTKHHGSGPVENASDSVLDESTEGKIYKLVRSNGYDYEKLKNYKCKETKNNDLSTYGVCIVKYCPNGTKTASTYYKVTTYISLQVPVLEVSLNIPISGETRTIYNDVGMMDCNAK